MSAKDTTPHRGAWPCPSMRQCPSGIFSLGTAEEWLRQFSRLLASSRALFRSLHSERAAALCPTACLILALILLLLTAQDSLAQGYAWQQRGFGGGGRFTCVTVNPANPAEVFVGSDVAGYFKSTDHGESFRLLGAGLEGFAVAGIAVNPDNSKEVLVLTDDGLYASEDEGETVSKITAKAHYKSRFFGSRLLVRVNGSWIAASDSDGVMRLARGPAGWSVSPLFGLEGKKVNALGLYKNRLIAATDEGVFVHDGEIWKIFSEGLTPGKRDMVDMAVHPGGALYAVEKQTGCYDYNESQGRWERRGPNLNALPVKTEQLTFKALAVSPRNAQDLFLATHPKSWPFLLLNSQDGGRNWSLVKRFAITDSTENWAKDLQAVEQVAFSPDNRVMYLTDWWNVWRSMDGGASWLQTYKGLQNTVVNDVQFSPMRPQSLYLAVDDNGMVISRDNGQTWRRRMAGVKDGHAVAVRVSPKNPDKVYLLLTPWKSEDTAESAYFYVYKSLDGGDTWTALPVKTKKRAFDKPYVDGKATGLVISPASDDVIFITTNGYGIFQMDTAEALSGDKAGEVSARNISAGIPTPYLKGRDALVVNPANPGTMLAATLEGGIYRTEDGGANWKAVGPAKTFTFDLAMDQSDPNRVYAGSSEMRVYRSTDSGLTWQPVSLPEAKPGQITVSALAVDKSQPGTVYAGTSAPNFTAAAGMFVSHDYGASFSKADSPLPRVNINILTPLGGTAGVLVGFNGLGLYQASAGPKP